MSENYFKHIDYIKNIKRWNTWPFCPVMKKGEKDIDNVYGVIHVENLTTIKKANLFILPPTKQEFLALDGWTYDTVEKMVTDGWEVD